MMIVGNWKMNMDRASAQNFAETLVQFLSQKKSNNEIAIAPPHTLLHIINNFPAAKLVAQDVSRFDNGAHTGEVSAMQLKDAGCSYVIVGHSERRQSNFETNEMVRKKALQVIANDMLPIICVGETLEEKEQGRAEQVLIKQISESVPDIKMPIVIVAYEPVWAIGTGKVPTNNDIEFAAKVIKKQFGQLNSFEKNQLILYGGSVKSSNCQDIMKIDDISGLLIGGASLQVEEFINIIDKLN